MMGEYFKHNQISDTAKGMLAAGLRTPSLGTWQLFSRELYKELKEANHGFLCNDFATAFEALDKALNQEKTNVISFRNGYAHGATPTDEQCENDIKQFEPFLNILLSLQWLNESNIEAIDGKVYLKNETDVLNLHPIIAYRTDETEQPFVFFNDLKNDKVGLLNYPLSKHYRDKSFFSEFNQYLPLQEWKKTGSNIFNQRIEELTETFKGRLTERATIKKFVTTKQKGFLSIQGNPGIGKSALIAQVYKDLTNSEEKLPIQLVEYFIRRGTSQAEVSYLINYLLKKTDEFFPAGKEIRAEGQTTWELQQQLYNKWTAFGEIESPFKIIFLIDGLDEGVENDILKYLPRENFNNILFMYGSRPGGHQQLDKFWGELSVEHHQKIELGGLSKEDIRALLYEVANKYEIDKDSAWIDYLQKRSEGNPLYLKLLCNAIEEGSIAINDVDALPKEIDDYYKAILQRYAQMPDGDHLLNSLFVFAAARDYLTPMHLSEILGFGPATQTNVLSTLVEVLYENPMTENVLDYQLFHESLREYLKKDRATEVAKAELKIIEFCGRWNTLEGNYEQQYILRHFAAHLSTQQNQEHHQTLIALTKDAEFIATQKKVLRNFEATHQLFQNGIEIATKNNWNEAAIDCGLVIVDLKYEEQNDVTAILEMVKQNEIELTLQRITALGGLSKDDKQRQFIVIMLCIMELTLLESKNQPWRKNAIEKLLGLMEEQIPVDHSILDWDRFFSSYLVFLIAVELKAMDLDFIEIYKRTDGWENKWIKNKGPYSNKEFDILIQTAGIVNKEWKKFSAFIGIACELGKQGDLVKFSKIIETLMQISEVDDLISKSSYYSDIAILLANQGEIVRSNNILFKLYNIEKEIKIEWQKNYVLNKIVLLLVNQGEMDKSIQVAENIDDYKQKSLAFKDIAVVLANLEFFEESRNILEKSIDIAKDINNYYDKNLVYKEIAVVLVNQGQIEKSILMVEGIDDDFDKSTAYREIAVVLANQGMLAKSDHILEQSVQIAEVIETDWKKSLAFKEISIVLANRSEIKHSMLMTDRINDDWHKTLAFSEIAVVLMKQDKFSMVINTIQKSIQASIGLNDDWHKISIFKNIALRFSNLIEIEKAIQVAEGINYKVDKCSLFAEISFELLNTNKFEESNMLFEKSIRTAEIINDTFEKSNAFMQIAIVLANQGELDKAIQMTELLVDYLQKDVVFKELSVFLANQGEIEKSIQMSNCINLDWNVSSVFVKISQWYSNHGELEKSIIMAEGINDERGKSIAFKEIAVVLANHGNLSESSKLLNKSIEIAEGINDDYDKNLALKEIAIVLAIWKKIASSNDVIQKINSGADRMQAWLEIGKEFYKKHQLQNLHQTLSQLPNDEAITFFKKGIAQSITATNATEETILQILPLVKADKESTEYLLQMHALYCAFFEKTPKEKIQKFNRSLNIQWALDVIATFPKEENVVRLSTNLEEWIAEVEDEDDIDQIRLWAKQVAKGKMTEEEFGENVKGMC